MHYSSTSLLYCLCLCLAFTSLTLASNSPSTSPYDVSVKWTNLFGRTLKSSEYTITKFDISTKTARDCAQQAEVKGKYVAIWDATTRCCEFVEVIEDKHIRLRRLNGSSKRGKIFAAGYRLKGDKENPFIPKHKFSIRKGLFRTKWTENCDLVLQRKAWRNGEHFGFACQNFDHDYAKVLMFRHGILKPQRK